MLFSEKYISKLYLRPSCMHVLGLGGYQITSPTKSIAAIINPPKNRCGDDEGKSQSANESDYRTVDRSTHGDNHLSHKMAVRSIIDSDVPKS